MADDGGEAVTLQRYDTVGRDADHEAHDEGDWVFYSDLAPLLAALDEILALASAPVAINQNAGERNRHALNLVRYAALAAIKEVRGE